MKPIRVVVIDDSAFMRKMISDILESDSRIKVIGTARNGKLGIEKIKELSPDVATLDVNMPVMDGFTALEYIMKATPLPVIILSGDTTEGADKTIRSIQSGAVDFIKKPSGPISLNIEDIKEEIISKVITASKADVSGYKKENKQPEPIKKVNKSQTAFPPSKKKHRIFVTIGTSTGGPRALQQLLTALPANFTAPIFIVQHMPKGFTKSLADRLNNLCDIHVKEAEHGEIVYNETVYIAPGDYHMRVVKKGRAYFIELGKDQPQNGHRPSVDTLFNSIAQLDDVAKVAVILTGMGSDGTKGITKLKQSDPSVYVLSETKETCVVYGMPKAAYESGYVDEVLPLYEMGQKLFELTE